MCRCGAQLDLEALATALTELKAKEKVTKEDIDRAYSEASRAGKSGACSLDTIE